ncbi:MAG: Mur ligase family protein [Bacteroidota bacterium]
MTYDDARAYLDALPRWAAQGQAAYQPGLTTMERLMEGLGRPHEAFPSVHVGGTNGKGSTASMLAAIATASGRRTGLHTSPHLLDFAERMRIDGQAAPHAWIAGAVARHRALFDAVRPSFFEATVALSFLYFAEMAVDLAVVEVGLGGRLDATNVLAPAVALVTYIGLDHTDVLGTTKAAIAREKAGIAKPGVPFLTAEPDPALRAVLRAEAEARGASFEAVRETVTVEAGPSSDGAVRLDVNTPERRFADLCMGLPGTHQTWNAALAVRAAETAGIMTGEDGSDRSAVRQGLAGVRKLAGIRGRCEVWSESPLTVLDVSHNAEGLAAALAFVQARQHARREGTAGGRLQVLLGLMRDKDLDALVPLLRRAEATITPVSLDSARARSAAELRAAFAAAGLALSLDDAPTTPHEALAWLHRRITAHDAVLATGSHLVAAAVLRAADEPA